MLTQQHSDRSIQIQYAVFLMQQCKNNETIVGLITFYISKAAHRASLKSRFENISEGISKQGAEILLNNIYTQLYITEGESEGINKEHEVWQLESASRSQSTEDTSINCNDIFKPLSGQEKHIRTVMTKGVAGIGKTVSVQKFILDWTDSGANQDVDFMFPLSFRELNLIRGGQYSLHSLLLDFHPELKELNDSERYKDCQVVFIFDGLDESRLNLDLEQNSKLSDVKQKSSVDLLMTSLIQGTLLPSALIWITSRPAAASQIPAQYINQLTEIRGFNDPQKEEYFRKRISDESQANRIILHIKATRSLYIMCHIPVFCWIAATVLQQMLEQDNTQEIPRTLTEMFIHFLLIQTTRKNQKYQRCETNSEKLLESHKHVILKLADLAYKHLLQGNLMFYDEDLKECGIEVSEASVYSGVFTEIFKEESVFHQKKIYSFVHLSIQEFLAALHVFLSFKNMNEKLSAPELFFKKDQLPLEELLEKAADKALQSNNGHLDLFLRFLMGISLERNHRLLQGLLTHPLNSSESIRKTCKYIKELNREDISPERCINLFHCLFEMNDHSIHEDIQEYLQSPKDFKGQLSPTHCSVLAHMLLMSEEVLDEFDLKVYNTSAEGRRRLIPAVRCFRKARLSGCNLSNESLEIIASVLQSPNSLIVLDLSNNDLKDAQHQLLSAGMHNPNCKLQTLRLTGCNLSDDTCEIVASVLQSSNSLIELDLSNNILRDSGVQSLSAGLYSHNCKLQTLRLPGCNLTDKSCGIVASVLQSPNSLIELDLSNNDLGDSGVQLLSAGLSSYYCKLQILRLPGCNLSAKFCEIALQSPNFLIELDLSNNNLGDSGVKCLSEGMHSPNSKLQILRGPRSLSGEWRLLNPRSWLLSSGPSVSAGRPLPLAWAALWWLCSGLSRRLQLLPVFLHRCLAYAMPRLRCVEDVFHPFGLRERHGQRAGGAQAKMFSQPLRVDASHKRFQCHFFILPGCNLSDESCRIVASVLQSSNSLTELDLSLNDLRDSGAQYLSAGLYSHNCKLQTLRLSECTLSEKSCGIVATVLQSPNSLIVLTLSHNDLRDSGVQLLSTGLYSSHCKLQALRLAECKLSEKSCEIVATALQSPNSLIELNLSHNDLRDSGVQLLMKELSSSHYRLQTVRFAGCKLSEKSCGIVATVLQSPNSLIELDLSHNDLGDSGVQLLSKGLDNILSIDPLLLAECKLLEKYCGIVATVLQSPNSMIELDLSHNYLGDSGVQLLSKGLSSPHCKLQTLRVMLADCKLTDKLCKIVTSVLQSPNSLLLLDLSGNDLGDSGTQLLSEGLSSSNCILQTLRLADCKLAEKSCEIVASILQLPNSLLQLDLSDNGLGDSGVQLLSKGLSSSNCKIHTLRLSDCLILEKGCGFLASALRSNPFFLKEMDLSYNHPGESGLELLSARLEDPVCKLEILKTDDASVSRTRPCLLKYACELTLDPNTAGRNLSLSDGNRKVTCASEKQLYPDHPERFDWKYQVLCREGLSGRCYWEAEWSGDAARIAVAYKSIKRKGEDDDIIMGLNAKSWSLRCSPDSYSAWHNNKHIVIPSPSSRSRRVGVYLDWPAGTLSFYSVSSDTLTQLHTFHSTFTEPLCPGFWVWSSVSLCQILHLRHSVSNRKRWLLHRFYSNPKNFISTFENTSVLQPKNKIVW
ncbi:NACHT, LRR and PYD domains-containing protein 12-like [Alosa pseudoharengus]|uniref:NACHT, LRR and PYD domains-containing protein 12-like n=1 Tax=Alosa pseudoharengus TaxID=34774 RepID=UPI003F8C9A48